MQTNGEFPLTINRLKQHRRATRQLETKQSVYQNGPFFKVVDEMKLKIQKDVSSNHYSKKFSGIITALKSPVKSAKQNVLLCKNEANTDIKADSNICGIEDSVMYYNKETHFCPVLQEYLTPINTDSPEKQLFLIPELFKISQDSLEPGNALVDVSMNNSCHPCLVNHESAPLLPPTYQSPGTQAITSSRDIDKYQSLKRTISPERKISGTRVPIYDDSSLAINSCPGSPCSIAFMSAVEEHIEGTAVDVLDGMQSLQRSNSAVGFLQQTFFFHNFRDGREHTLPVSDELDVTIPNSNLKQGFEEGRDSCYYLPCIHDVFFGVHDERNNIEMLPDEIKYFSNQMDDVDISLNFFDCLFGGLSVETSCTDVDDEHSLKHCFLQWVSAVGLILIFVPVLSKILSELIKLDGVSLIS